MHEHTGLRGPTAHPAIIFSLLVALLVPGPALAQEAPHLSLQDAIEEALVASPGLNAATELSAGADLDANAAFRQHFGQINAVAWASRYQDDQGVRPISGDLISGGLGGLPFDRDQFHYGLSFELPLFVGGKLHASVRIARLKADESRALLGGTRWQLRSNVTSIYAASQAIDRAILAFEDQVDALEKTHEHLQLMVETGKKPIVDLLKVVETLEEARAELASAYADRVHTRAVLAALLDRPSVSELILDPLPDEPPRILDETTDWARLLEESSTLRSSQLRVEEAEYGKGIARSEFLPRLALRGNLLGHAAPSVEGPLETWELSLAATWPLFTGGRSIAGYQSASAKRRASEFALRQTRLQLNADLEGNLARLKANQVELQAAQRRVEASDEAARIEELRYETGAGTIEDLLRAQTRKASAEAALAKAEGQVVGTAARINAMVETEVVR